MDGPNVYALYSDYNDTQFPLQAVRADDERRVPHPSQVQITPSVCYNDPSPHYALDHWRQRLPHESRYCHLPYAQAAVNMPVPGDVDPYFLADAGELLHEEAHTSLNISYGNPPPDAGDFDILCNPECTPGTYNPSFFAPHSKDPSLPLLVQHAPVAPQHQSSYSELAANIAFFSTMTHQNQTNSEVTQPSSLTLQACARTLAFSQASGTVHEPEEIEVRSRHQLRSSSHHLFTTTVIPPPLPDSSPPSTHPKSLGHTWTCPNDPLPEFVTPISSTSRAQSPSSSSSSPASSYGAPTPVHASRARSSSLRKGVGNEARRPPSLACFFCRERKIACGRPAEGSADPRCNQCRRRQNHCDYPKESLRGQHRRGTGRHGNVGSVAADGGEAEPATGEVK
ncbi:hypothetical protein FPV67DRAFT_1477952 [Lyophyllum atratum]|nr:hypothetical protein FPV67DRAFT_1477952 [Lyophyllum atratum]